LFFDGKSTVLSWVIFGGILGNMKREGFQNGIERGRFVIEGGRRLSGTIAVRGSKNATTPILAATILTDKPCILRNVPRIEDVFVMLEILESMGSHVVWRDERTVEIRNEHIDPKQIDIEKVKKIRSSILLLGALAARFDSFSLPHPGGCVIGARPVGTHFDALDALGVSVSQKEKSYQVDASKRVSAKIVLREFSVTATENAMMLAAVLEGETVIKIAAAEPHVEDLGRFLQSLGVEISGLGTHTMVIRGKRRDRLSGAEHTIISDANEAATFLILGAATGSDIVVKNAREEHLDLVLERLREFGVGIKVLDGGIRVFPDTPLRAIGKLDARIYPGIPTDIQAPFGVLATQAEGETLIHDTLFEGRFNYVGELQKMGANAHILNPHQALIVGKTPLRGTTIFSYDLRAGAALIIAALLAEGTTVIEDAYQVDRGYEKIEERLRGLGASIKRQ
jgi:UDP-N-acetylglucosamine 1-carboxyvinyltransferase